MRAWRRIFEIFGIHLLIQFMALWSHSSVNVLDIKIILKDGKIITGLYVKPTDINQYLDSLTWHLHHCKSSIPYSQAFHFIRIGSNNAFFDKRCNKWEYWLPEWWCIERVVRQEMLKSRKIPRNEMWEKKT